MTLKRIGYYKFDTEDKLGKCQLCKGDIYNVPEYIWRLGLNERELELFKLGALKIGLCPVCMTFYTVEDSKSTILR